MDKHGITLVDAATPGEEISPSTLSTGFRMSGAFWDEFIGKYWNSGPVLVRKPFAEPLLTAEDAFEIMKRAGNNRQSSESNEKYVFVNGGKRICDLDEYLPRAADRSLQEYTERLSRLVEDQEITLLLPKLQLYDSGLWMRVRVFLKPLYERIGIPASAADLDMFYGQYDRTPHGIHRDEASNFSYVISGKKKMLFWAADAFPTQTGRLLGTTRYEDHLESAIELEAEPGDVMFWPASYWHIAISDGGWPLTLNLNSYLFRHPLHSLFQAISSPEMMGWLNTQCSPSLLLPADLNASSPSVPVQIQCSWKLLRALADHERFEDTAEDLWFRKLSATGFEAVPSPANVPSLKDETTLRSNPDFPILLAPRAGGQARLFANGHMLETAMDASLEAMISRLNTGTEIKVGTLLSTCVPSDSLVATHEELRCTLASLCSFRALTVS